MTVVRGAHDCPALFIRRFLIIVKREKLEAECFRGRSRWVNKLRGEKHQKGKIGKCYKHFRSSQTFLGSKRLGINAEVKTTVNNWLLSSYSAEFYEEDTEKTRLLR
ncbi:hypothetical protein AVEN_25199-1 [Araneus ventricosus]|uniref:Uncharacterized protein n=1 Tax=Araneus ventricosus TaxID=182803 RepID=A0A4Y2SYR5_ARAVE|nr:hypothetical protein AVEN_25199-1 [Araneus ventricosus]